MAKGLEIAKEKGIKKVNGRLYKFNREGEVCGACAVGMMGIAVFGTNPKKLNRLYSSNILNAVNIGNWDKNTCFNEKIGGYGYLGTAIITANDTDKKPLRTILKALQECDI